MHQQHHRLTAIILLLALLLQSCNNEAPNVDENQTVEDSPTHHGKQASKKNSLAHKEKPTIPSSPPKKPTKRIAQKANKAPQRETANKKPVKETIPKQKVPLRKEKLKEKPSKGGKSNKKDADKATKKGNTKKGNTKKGGPTKEESKGEISNKKEANKTTQKKKPETQQGKLIAEESNSSNQAQLYIEKLRKDEQCTLEIWEEKRESTDFLARNFPKRPTQTVQYTFRRNPNNDKGSAKLSSSLQQKPTASGGRTERTNKKGWWKKTVTSVTAFFSDLLHNQRKSMSAMPDSKSPEREPKGLLSSSGEKKEGPGWLVDAKEKTAALEERVCGFYDQYNAATEEEQYRLCSNKENYQLFTDIAQLKCLLAYQKTMQERIANGINPNAQDCLAKQNEITADLLFLNKSVSSVIEETLETTKCPDGVDFSSYLNLLKNEKQQESLVNTKTVLAAGRFFILYATDMITCVIDNFTPPNSRLRVFSRVLQGAKLALLFAEKDKKKQNKRPKINNLVAKEIKNAFRYPPGKHRSKADVKTKFVRTMLDVYEQGRKNEKEAKREAKKKRAKSK